MNFPIDVSRYVPLALDLSKSELTTDELAQFAGVRVTVITAKGQAPGYESIVDLAKVLQLLLSHPRQTLNQVDLVRPSRHQRHGLGTRTHR